MISINFNYNVRTDSIPSQGAPQELREKKDMTKVITAIALTILCGIGVFFYARYTNLRAHSLTQVDLCSGTIRIITQLAQAVFQTFRKETLKTVVKMIIGLFSVYIVKRGIKNWRLHKAEKAVEEGNFQVAKKRIDDLPEDYFKENRTMRIQVKLYMRIGELGKAGEMVTKLPNHPVASEGDLILKARFHLISGKYIESRYFIRKAIKKNPGRADAQITRAGLKVLMEGDVEGFYKISRYGISLDRKKINKVHLNRYYLLLVEFFKLIGCDYNAVDEFNKIQPFCNYLENPSREIINNMKIFTKRGAEPLEKFLSLKNDILTGVILEEDQLYDLDRYLKLSPYYQKLLCLELYYHRDPRDKMVNAKKLINELLKRRPGSIYLKIKNALISLRNGKVKEKNNSYHLLQDFFEKNRVGGTSLLNRNYLDFDYYNYKIKSLGKSVIDMDQRVYKNSIFQLQEEKIVSLIHEMILHVS